MKAVGGARRGLDMWLVQRASALYMAAFIVFFALRVARLPALDFASWHALFVPGSMKVGVLLFVAATLLHAWIGMREIVIDYLHCRRCLGARLAVYFTLAVFYLGCLVWTAGFLWSVR